MAETLSYVHRFEKSTEADARSLLLLHGTGGDENDLVPLGRMVAACRGSSDVLAKWTMFRPSGRQLCGVEFRQNGFDLITARLEERRKL